MIVTFCGHRKLQDKETIAPWLEETCEALIQEGADVFYLGGYGDFDLMALHVLKRLKGAHPNIRLVLVLAYLNSSKPYDDYDETMYPPLETVPFKLAIIRRNEWMVEHADAVVACIRYGWGGAAGMLEYARRKGKRVVG